MERIINIDSTGVKTDSFVLYRLPFQSKKHLVAGKAVILEQGLNTEHLSSEGFVFEPFDNTTNQGVFIEMLYKDNFDKVSSEIYNDLLSLVNDGHNSDSLLETDLESYRKQFKSLYQHIVSGEIDKVILSRVKKTEKISDNKVFEVFEKLSDTYSHAFVYMIKTPYSGLWIGAGPELLLRNEGHKLQTVALAGTIPNNDNDAWHDKEISEQKFVTDYIVKVLENLNTKNIDITGPETTIAGQVKHLKTDITFDCPADKEETIKLLYDLHPTPAVCGMPRQKAHELIRNHENYNRGFYTGFLGPVSKGNFEFYVNIRCMQVTGDKTALYVGGGLTSDSILEKEWEETELKAQTLLSVLKNI